VSPRRPEQPSEAGALSKADDGRRAARGVGFDCVEDVLSQQTIARWRETLSVEARRDLHRIFDELLPARVRAIERAARSGDRIELKRAAHLLRGSATMIGATRLGQACRQFEQASETGEGVGGEARLARLAAVAAEARQALSDSLA
jgi:HPt (histidine-containing phosphotransfer) domain-containing protein